AKPPTVFFSSASLVHSHSWPSLDLKVVDSLIYLGLIKQGYPMISIWGGIALSAPFPFYCIH
ncbi:hypothetical protein, partial [[Ruminococcus] torques]|uniref:hypothetical protein n=1 Tax=[Ruminococcus] torques TaxID=33039 RepID=UPI001EE14660